MSQALAPERAASAFGEPAAPPEGPLVLVVGNGPVGVHFVNQLLGRGWPGRVKLFGEEEYPPYNRVQLSAFLNREVSWQQLQNPVRDSGRIEQICCRVAALDPEKRRVLDQFGRWHGYDMLVLATGSRPHVPGIPGRDRGGVYRFRDLRDAERLFARQWRSRHTVVIGGGLLGLETARAMARFSTGVTVVQHSPRLMNRQLDQEASDRLRAFAEASGLVFRLNTSVKEICGGDRVEYLRLSNGSVLPCDTLVFATGIAPNRELALEAGLKVGNGIQIDADLSTSAEHVFAIGECAEFQGQVLGLAAPGLEQAAILAERMCGGTGRYGGAALITELKVLGLQVHSMGRTGEEYARQIDARWRYREGALYRCLLLHKGRLAGAIAVGPWPEAKAVQAALEEGRSLRLWHKRRFERGGRLHGAGADPLALPDTTIICNCRQVSLGEIRRCRRESADPLRSLQQALGVATVCGSCKPLLQIVLRQPVERLPVKNGLAGVAFGALLLAAALLLVPAPPVSESVRNAGLEWLWTDSLPRQLSGFAILGLGAASLLLSLRKRLHLWRRSSFDAWRLGHGLLAGLALAGLFLHTGLSLGEGLNRWLILNFLALAAVGALAAAAAAVEGRLACAGAKSLKRTLVLCHLVAFWPLPVLLGFHMLSVYYF